MVGTADLSPSVHMAWPGKLDVNYVCRTGLPSLSPCFVFARALFLVGADRYTFSSQTCVRLAAHPVTTPGVTSTTVFGNTPCVPPDLEAQYKRRNGAIRDVMAYCLVEEGRTSHRVCGGGKGRACGELRTGQFRCRAVLSVFVRKEKERSRRCFVCVRRKDNDGLKLLCRSSSPTTLP